MAEQNPVVNRYVEAVEQAVQEVQGTEQTAALTFDDINIDQICDRVADIVGDRQKSDRQRRHANREASYHLGLYIQQNNN